MTREHKPNHVRHRPQRGTLAPLAIWALTLAPAVGFANHYVDDPCAIPAPKPLGGNSCGANPAAHCPYQISIAPDLVARRNALVAKGSALDGTADQFNARCNVEQVVGSPAEAACARDEAALKGHLDAYDRNVADFNRALAADYGVAEQTLTARLAVTAGKLKSVGRGSDALAKDAAEWVRMGEEARQKARLGAFEKMVSWATDDFVETSRAEAKLTQTELSAFKRWYRDTNRVLPAALKSEMGGRILKLNTRADVTSLLKYIEEQHMRAYDVAGPLGAGHAWEATGQAVVGVLRLTLSLTKETSMEAKLAVDIADMAVDDTEGWTTFLVAKSLTEKSLELRDLDLRAIRSLADSYRRDVDRLAAIRAQQKLVASGCR
jgi:hypothetical protein